MKLSLIVFSLILGGNMLLAQNSFLGTNGFKLITAEKFTRNFNEDLPFSENVSGIYTLEDANLKGNVRQVKYESGAYLLFNKEGKVVERCYVAAFSNDPLKRITTYTYNDNGQMLTETMTKNGELAYEITYEIKADGTVIEKKKVNANVTERSIHFTKEGVPDGNCDSEYDASGKLTQAARFFHCYTFEYESETNRLLKANSNYQDFEFSYYPDGKLYKVKLFEKNKVRKEFTYLYDEKGKWLKLITTGFNGGQNTTSRYNLFKFKFDAQQNWTECIIQSSSGISEPSIFRTISYY